MVKIALLALSLLASPLAWGQDEADDTDSELTGESEQSDEVGDNEDSGEMFDEASDASVSEDQDNGDADSAGFEQEESSAASDDADESGDAPSEQESSSDEGLGTPNERGGEEASEPASASADSTAEPAAHDAQAPPAPAANPPTPNARFVFADEELPAGQAPTSTTEHFRVAVNAEEQYSIWPADRELPGGWSDGGMTGTKQEALEYIKEKWTDMRPQSLRRQMEQSAKEPE